MQFIHTETIFQNNDFKKCSIYLIILSLKLIMSSVRFSPIATRSEVRGTVADKYVEIFAWYEADLNEVQNIYEKNKVCCYK